LHGPRPARAGVFLGAGFLAFAIVSLADDPPVSFSREVAPILKHNCQGCHRPGKARGGLDVTTFATLMKGGKHGETFKSGAPADSSLLEQISGDDPEMPKDDEPLLPGEVQLIERWIAQGAKDDTPAGQGADKTPTPPVYRLLPAVASMAWSPDGALLAVTGAGEVVLHSGDGERIAGRLVGTAPRVESLSFSADGKMLAVAGGAPSEFGEVQLWNVAGQNLLRTIRTSHDSVFGVSFSPDGMRVAVGCADKLVRVFAVETGAEIMKCDNHIDWVFGTAFSMDGARLVSASRDKAVKLIDVATGHLIDDVNIPREPVVSLARHPHQDIVAFGSDAGAVRLHKIEPRGGRLAEGDNKENSALRELERLRGSAQAVAFSADGAMIAVGSTGGEWRIFKTDDGKRLASSKEAGMPIFALAFDPQTRWLATAGADGRLRFYDPVKGDLVRTIDAVPLADAPR
jgi:WD40 repeat protein